MELRGRFLVLREKGDRSMASRSVWSGNLQVGMVGTGVKLCTGTTEAEKIRFNQLHAKCGCQLKQELFCPNCNVAISDRKTEMKRGYKVDDSTFVEVTDEELASANFEKTSTIDVFRVVDPKTIPAVFFSDSFNIVLDKKGVVGIYAILYHAMIKRGFWGVGKLVMRNKESIVAIEPHDGLFTAYKLHFCEEVKGIEEFADLTKKVLEAKIDDKQLELACKILDTMTGDFSPAQFRDEWSAIVRDIIEKKAKGEWIAPEMHDAPRGNNVVDLTAMLEATLQRAVNQ
jgi:DNA end-binding protein Ku